MAKEGSPISGLMDSFATSISFALQYGVRVEIPGHVRFEPSGWTGNQQIPYAKSIMDYIFRWMGARFPGREYAATKAANASVFTEPVPQQERRLAGYAGCPLCSEMRRPDDAQRKLLQV